MQFHPLVHVGMHKTGSTLFQQRLFLEKYGFRQMADPRRRIPDVFVNRPALEGVPKPEIDSIRAEAEDASAAGLVLCVSHERLSGYPASAGFDAPIIADRLKEALPDSRVLVVVREQRKMIRSFYLQYVTDGGSRSFRSLTSPMQPNLRRTPEFDFSFYEYDRVVALYQRIFGAGSVMVVPFERLRRDGATMAREIAEFAGVSNAQAIPDDVFSQPVNAANPLVMQSVTRRLNGLLGRNQLASGAPIRIQHLAQGMQKLKPLFEPFRVFDKWLSGSLTKQIETAVDGRYAASNDRLAAMTGLDLTAYGYATKNQNSDEVSR